MKRIGFVVAGLAMVLSAQSLYLGMASFVDVDGWEKAYVEELEGKGVFSTDNDYFRGGDSITRAEALKMIFKVFGQEVAEVDADKTYFAEIPAGMWANKYFVKLHGMGVLDAELGDEVKAWNSMTRAEFLKVMYGVMSKGGDICEEGYCGVDNTLYSDVPADSWVAPYVLWAREYGLLSEGDNVYPWRFVTRREVAKLIVEGEKYIDALSCINEGEEIYSSSVNVCCQGLSLIPVVEDGEYVDNIAVCSPCGNNMCDVWETFKSCPGDCQDVMGGAMSGEFGVMGNASTEEVTEIVVDDAMSGEVLSGAYSS